MYIGFSGAGGVGKTTTANLLAKNLGIATIPSVSRPILTRYFPDEASQRSAPLEVVYTCQKEISNAKLEQDEAHRQDKNDGVCDRTPIDQFTYMLYRCGPLMSEEDLNIWGEKAFKGLSAYDYLFYFPLVTYPGQEDGLRESGYGYRACIDLIMRQLTKAAEGRFIYMPEQGTPEERVSFILDMIQFRTHVKGQGPH